MEQTPHISAATREKYQRLKAILTKLGRVLVAFSGGVDSSLLLKAALESLGDDVLAVTALSATTPAQEKKDAAEFARSLGVRHLTLETQEMENPAFTSNPADKCYLCKQHRFGELVRLAAREGIGWVLDGENLDDDADYRPGNRAARELGVRSPLRESGLNKQEIRQISRELGLVTWNKPAYACLASRIPYGQPITAAKLRQVDAAETFIRELGIARQVRIRHEGSTARIEVEPQAIPRLVQPEPRRRITARLTALGFKFVALDLEGYRTGSLNETLEAQAPARSPVAPGPKNILK
ncbi:MAG: ATP-dependent sacrificial sulfur transferase LarE [Desulfobacterales bacterium]